MAQAMTEGLTMPFLCSSLFPSQTSSSWVTAAYRRSFPASGGEPFTAEKFPKRAGGCGPRSPWGLRGVHPKKWHLPDRYAPPSRPVPYCLPPSRLRADQ